MRIAQVSPLYESVPPKLYGGTERVVSYLTEELVRQGHDVTLFASGDSRTAAKLVPCCDEALRLRPGGCHDPLPHHLIMMERVFRRAEAGEFDLVHVHVDYLHLPLARRSGVPYLTTLHGRLDIPDLVPLYAEYDDLPLVSISNAQRRPLSRASWLATVHHGLPGNLLRLHHPVAAAPPYLAFLGRISPEKGVDAAIEIARLAGLPLRIAAKVSDADRKYYHAEIEPLLRRSDHVTFVGEIDERRKQDFLGNAAAVLFPICWPEPFGLVQIEAMACGTPVIAFPRGSVCEVIDDGITGLICHDVDEAARAVRDRLPRMSRIAVRAQFDRRFTATRMAADYVRLYEQAIRTSGQPPVRTAGGPALAPDPTPALLATQMIDCPGTDAPGSGNGHGRDHSGRRSALHPGDLAAGGRAVARP
jgi:glycosyltransferase involved in cell wall biosynthesis